jgi:hypothetical protein
MLTIIALALVGIYFKTPTPFTLENVRSKKVQMTEIPLVRVQGGSINADVTGSVEIDR